MPARKIWRGKWTKRRLADAAKEFAGELGHTPNTREWIRSGPCNLKTVYKLYPSWAALLAAAKLPPSPLQAGRWNREQATTAIRSFTKTHGRPPQNVDLKKANGLPNRLTLERHFGTVTLALEAAGVARPDPWAEDEKILHALRVDAKKRGRNPTVGEWRRARKSHPSASAVQARFGGSWRRALVEAGLLAESELPAETPDRLLKREVLGKVREAFGAPERTPAECLSALIEGLEELRQQASL